MALLARSMGRSSERFFKTYYRYGFYIGLPFYFVLMFVLSRDPISSRACYSVIIMYVLVDLTVTYIAWQKCSGKGF